MTESCSTVATVDHGGFGFSGYKYPPNTSLTFPFQQFSSIGHSQAKKYLQVNPKPFQQVLWDFKKIPEFLLAD